jgi:hypothetical protein
MISADEAREIASQYVLRQERRSGITLKLVHEQTIEKPFGWVFFYDSKAFLETGNFESTILGNAPIIVNRRTGELHVTGTAKPIEEYIADYDRELET